MLFVVVCCFRMSMCIAVCLIVVIVRWSLFLLSNVCRCSLFVDGAVNCLLVALDVAVVVCCWLILLFAV